ncbi:tape measure protein [Acidovorax kalamii]|uniref:tape measure protein n=1 Tax=Acidovorax kalamii TaxID=2004485 RepID=UPI002090E850|nr:tape measure protein [Acidovorax kalamii]MCO5355056.1 tape measure protein [Acidovorax kalamii]
MGGVEGAAAKTGKTLENLGQGRAATSLNKVGEAAGGAAREMGRVNQASDQVSRGLSGMASNADLAAKAIASIGIAASVQQYLRVADAVTALNNSLKLSAGSVQSASAAYEDLFQIAQRSRVGFLQLGETYSSISRATGELGVSQARMLKVTESIANAMTIGGGSAQSMNAALVQLGQGLASGTLRGEELNSILEQAPRLAKALADGLGVPIGKLRELGAAGEITSQQIVKALESQSAVLAKEVTGATLTLGQAFTQLTNSGTKAVGEFDKASGASTSLAQAISSVATAMDAMGNSFRDNAGTIQTVMGALAGAAALTTLAAIPRAIAAVTAAVTGLSVVLSANPVVLTMLGVGAVVGGGLAAVNAYSKTADGIKSAVRSLEEANQRSESAMQRAMEGGRTAGADNIRKTIDDRKKAIRDLNAELALMSSSGLDNRVEEARLAAGTEQMQAQKRAAEELAGIKQKLSGVDKDYLPTLNKLFKQYQDGNIELGEYQRLVAKLAKDNFKADSGSNPALSDALDAKLQAYKNNDKAILDSRKAFYDAQALLVKLGGKSELDAIDESLAKEEEVWAQRKANFEAELAQAAKKKTSQAEVARITGQMRDAERDYEQNIAKLRAESALADAKSLDALEARVAGQEKASRAAMEQVRMAELEGKAIGLTGDALRVFNQQQLESSIPLALKMQAAWADQAGALGELGRAARDQIQAMRDLAKAQGENRAAQMVYEYAKGIEDSNKLLQAEIGLMGMSEQARTTALEQLRIQLDLEQKIAFVKANVADTDKQAADIAKLQASAAIAKANAANKAFLDEWKTSVGKYDDIFRQGFADMLNNGKDGWKSFTRSLVTTFKTTVADQIYKMFAQPFVVNIVGNLLGLVGGSAAQAVAGAASGGSALGTIGNAASGLSALTGTFGMGLRAGLSGLFGEAGLAGTISAGTTAIGAGNIAGGLGTLAGPLALVGGGLLVLNSLLKGTKGETRTGGQFGVSFDGTVTNQRRDQVYTYQGQQFDRDFSNGQRNALIAGQAYRLEGDPVQNEQAIRDAVSGTASGINAFLKALGSKATLTGFSAGLETSGKGRGGVFAGGILSDGTTFGESGKGDNYAGTLYEKFSTNSPDFKTALENFTLDLKQSTIQALQSVTDIPETVKKMLKGVDAEGLSEEAANALLESINAQIVGVQNLTSAFEAMGLDKLADMGFDAAAGLAAAAGGFDKLQGNLNTYYDNFYSEEEKRANLQKQVDKQFAALGLDVPKNRDEFRRLVESTLEQAEVQDKTRAALSKQINDAIAGAGKDGFTLADAGARSIVSGINPALLGNAEADPALAGKLDGFLSGVSDLAGKGLDPAAFQEGLSGLIAVNSEVLGIGKDASQTAAALLALSGTFAQLNESADDAAARIAKEQADARDKALRGLERAIDAEKKALQTQIDVAQDVASTMSGLFDLLKSNVRDLYDEVDSTRSMLAVQGNDFINQALSTARTTGYLPDETQLADAISAARGGLDSSGYASQFELDRDRLVLAGKLSELEGLTGKQLTSAERTVKELEAQSEQLDKTLDFWKQQIDIANGTYEATLSVTEAIKALEKLMFPDKVETGTLKPQQVGGGGSSGGAGFGPGFGGGTSTPAKIDATTGKRTFSDGSVDYLTEGELDLYRRGILGKVTYFDVGTNYVPKDMLAVVHKGEQIIPAAYNPMLNPGSAGDGNADLAAAVNRLAEQNALLTERLNAIEGNTRPMPKMAQQIDTYTNGGQFSRQKAMA